jgi:hypothetical protein
MRRLLNECDKTPCADYTLDNREGLYASAHSNLRLEVGIPRAARRG